MSGKKLLILERSQSNLDYKTDEDGSVVLEGVFTEIGVRNKNNRIYEEKEVLPHINELKEKVKTKKLLGELDHPKDFDISLANVSHVIENLTYDADKKQVIGKIRLLNTTKGKEAQALVKDGIPLHISSRAAGSVDESGKVKIKKFFTYDLVADPGFENAELSRVNESYGFDNDSGLLIYEMDEKETNTENNKDLTMENEKFVTVGDFQKYTEYVQGVLNNVKESANTNDNEIIEKLVKYTEHIAEKVNQVTDYAAYLSENLDKSITYSDYLAENVNKIKDYTAYLGEELDNSIQYTEHVAEKADKGIEYTNYLSENLEKSLEYSEYVAKKVDQNIGYSEHLAEALDKSIAYSEYVAENVNGTASGSINESKANEAEGVCEACGEVHEGSCSAKEESTAKDYKESIEEKLNKLIAKAETKNLSEMHFMNFLSESRKNEFNSLSEDKQKSIVESMNAKPIMSTNQAENIWESNFIEKKRELHFIDDMPAKYEAKWNELSESRKLQIIAESKFHTLNTPYTISNFWATRDLRSSQPVMENLNEGKTAAEQTTKAKEQSTINESYAADLVKRVKFNLGR